MAGTAGMMLLALRICSVRTHWHLKLPLIHTICILSASIFAIANLFLVAALFVPPSGKSVQQQTCKGHLVPVIGLLLIIFLLLY